MAHNHPHGLSFRLLRIVLFSALLTGVVVSGAQIAYQAYLIRQTLENDAARLMAMFRAAATQATRQLDQTLARQIVAGLLQHEAVRYASLGRPGETPLAERRLALHELPTRAISDPLLGPERKFALALPDPVHPQGAQLRLSLDTAPYGQAFVQTAAATLLTSLLYALLLALLLCLICWRPAQPGRQLATLNLRRAIEDPRKNNAHHDFLTGLPNRQLLQVQLQQLLDGNRGGKCKVAVLCLGLDGFREINERYSSQSGDQLLLALADYLRTDCGRHEGLARLGGDQFALIQTDIDQPQDAAELAQRILDGLKKPFVVDAHSMQLRATVGIALFPEDGDSGEVLLQKAEQTMTLAKRESRSGYQFYVASVDREMRSRRELNNDILQALELGQFHLVYQPQMNFAERSICGVEALLRWNHPSRGAIAPEQFIPLAEQNGSIAIIGHWVLDQACRQLSEWRAQGFASLRMAVNLSTVQLHNAELPRQVALMMAQYGLPAGSLELEITETGLMDDIDTAAKNLLGLRQSGALLAVDDFGTGHSSLSYLKSLPLDKVKIDKSFVRDLNEGQDDATIVRSIIQLAKNLGMQVIAEGVETPEQERYLVGLGCDEGQGYLYSKPLRAAELLSCLRQARVLGKDQRELVSG